jgi:hypothetical protein
MAYTPAMVWETVFFLVVLKIPVVYLACVVWWAIRAQPDGAEPAVVQTVSDTPLGGPGLGAGRRAPRRPRSGRPHGRRPVEGRGATLRAGARR